MQSNTTVWCSVCRMLLRKVPFGDNAKSCFERFHDPNDNLEVILRPTSRGGGVRGRRGYENAQSICCDNAPRLVDATMPTAAKPNIVLRSTSKDRTHCTNVPGTHTQGTGDMDHRNTVRLYGQRERWSHHCRLRPGDMIDGRDGVSGSRLMSRRRCVTGSVS